MFYAVILSEFEKNTRHNAPLTQNMELYMLTLETGISPRGDTLKRQIETEITFAEMVKELMNIKGAVISPVNVFDYKTILSVENYDQALKIMSAILSLRRGENINLSENGREPRFVASISIDHIWLSVPIAIISQNDMYKAFFENIPAMIWLEMKECSLKIKSRSETIDKLPEAWFRLGSHDLKIGIMKDFEGYSLYISKCTENPTSNDASIFVPLSEMRSFFSTIEKALSLNTSLQIDKNREDADKRLQKIKNIKIRINYHLNNTQKSRIGSLCFKDAETLMVF